MKTIYINGFGGVGNSLFQILTALSYEDANVFLVNTRILIKGFKINNNKSLLVNDELLTWKNTLLKNFIWVDGVNEIVPKFSNNFTNKKTKKNIFILEGYNQNVDLINFDMIKYLNLEHKFVNLYIDKHYPNLENSVCICLRQYKDFKHKKDITHNSYKKALEYLKENYGVSFVNSEQVNDNKNKLITISDVKDSWFFPKEYPAQDIQECDIIQFYIGLRCKYYILCESTFHLWFAYTSSHLDKSKIVIYFDKTDFTKRNLTFKNWIKIPC